MNALPEDAKAWVEEHVGFVDSAVDRIVPPSASATNDPLEVTVETFSEWIVINPVQRRAAEHPRHGVNRQPDGICRT